MPDAPYTLSNLVFKSLGITARPVDDTIAEGFYLNENSLEEIEENGIATRLGTKIINRTGSAVNALSGPVHSLSKLGGLFGAAFRYAGANGNLYRRSDLFPGAYTLISAALSGQPWQSAVWRPEISSAPYLFVCDANGPIKDNGTLAAPQRNGILQPQYPVQSQAQVPTSIVLDNYTGSSGAYAYTGIGGGTIGGYVATSLTSAVTATGIQAVSVNNPKQVGLFQLLTVDAGVNAEVVLVIQVTATGFVANFTKLHTLGVAVGNRELSLNVPASTTATAALNFGGTPIAAWPTTLEQADYIGLYLYVSDPAQIQSIMLKFDCGDGSFNSDYFWKTIGQGPLQSFLDTNTDSSTAAADAVLSSTLGLYSNSSSGIAQLNTGLNQWTPLLLQLSDFAGSGRANFSDPVFNWKNVNGYQIQIVTNDQSSVTVQLSSLLIFGGAGPDSFAGVSYGYAWTFYNPIDGTESNPSMFQTDVNPPFLTNRVLPRRQPVQLALIHPVLDPQATYARIYRIGGTLADAYRRIDQIPIAGASTQYTDIWSDADIQQADTLSLTNDAPLTVTLPVPVNTALAAGIATTNQVVNVFPADMTNISVSQQVDLGNVVSPDFEIVIVLTVAGDHFTAFVQNTHAIGEPVAATAIYGVAPTGIAVGFGQAFYWEPYNPSYLYFSAPSNPQAVGSASYTEVSVPSDAITVVIPSTGNLFVSTLTRWWIGPPGTQGNNNLTCYPTKADHGCVAPLGWCLKDGLVFYQAFDGIRVFMGSEGEYISRQVEFIWQGIGPSPIVKADQTQLSKTRMSWWYNMVFVSYVGVDGFRHRLIIDTINQRWRNDDVDCQSIYLETDTSSLIFGDSNGLVRQDRQPIAYDETNNAGVVQQSPIPFTLQTPYGNQGVPASQKNYNNLTVDANTNGIDVTATLLFDDGQFSQVIGVINTANRQKFNLNLNNGNGITAYKASLQLTGAGIQRVFLYQCALRAVILAQTRRSYDTWIRKFGTDQSKLCKNVYIEYTAQAPITCQVFYDGSSTPGFTFTLPQNSGIRNPFRQRLPAVKFRLLRMVSQSTADYQMWDESSFFVKPVQQGSGYEPFPLLSVEN